MSDNQQTAEGEDGDDAQSIEFDAGVVVQALELKQLIEEAGPELSDTQREQVAGLISEHTPDDGLSEDDVIRLIEENRQVVDTVSEDDVIRLIGEHTPDDGLTEDDVRRIIRDSGVDGDGSGNGYTSDEILRLIAGNIRTGYGGGLVIDRDGADSGGGDGDSGDGDPVPTSPPASGSLVSEDDVRRIVDQRIAETGVDEVAPKVLETSDRVNKNLDTLESTLSRKVGPPASALDTLVADHSYPGWGIHFSAHDPIRLGRTAVKAGGAGELNIELYKYRNGTTENLVATKSVDIPRAGTHSVDLDMRVPEGQYLLTRDWTHHPGASTNVDLARGPYDGWAADSGEEIILHGGAHPEHGPNTFWYYFYGLTIWPSDADDPGAESRQPR